MSTKKMDDRFNIINRDPRFRRMPRAERIVKIDRRFEGMFKDKQFKLKYSVDKRGRPMNSTTDDNLRRFYEMSDSESSDESDEGGKEQTVKKKSKIKERLDAKQKKKLNKESVKAKPNNLDCVNKTESKGLHQEKTSKPRTSKSRDVKCDEKLKMYKKTISEDNKQQNRQTGKKLHAVEKTGQLSTTVADLEKDISDESGRDSSNKSDEESEEEEDTSESDSSSDSDKANEDSGCLIPGKDAMRGRGIQESSSNSDSSDSEVEEEEGTDIVHGWGELDKDAARKDKESTRLAVCNMDWDRVKAKDLMVLLNSFKPTGGTIKSVTIYPSEYGLQRMKEEDRRGPQELVDHKEIENVNMSKANEQGFIAERLRKYQMQRLKYYYAVVECDSLETASAVYEQCDGMEYQSSSTNIDLRFIPEDMDFGEHKPKDVAMEMLDTTYYRPVDFRTTALHQSKVELTWDETDYMRKKKTAELFRKKDQDLETADVQAYLASSSGEEDDMPAPAFEIEEDDFGKTEIMDDEGQISKYRALLQGINEKEESEKKQKDMDVEITWEPGLKDTAGELVKKKMVTGELTPWETYLEKRKEKKKQRKAEKKKLVKQMVDTADDAQQQQEKAAFSDDDLPAGVDLEDSFFKHSLKDNTQNSSATSQKKKWKQQKQKLLTVEETEEQQKNKAELELLMMDEDDNKRHFNLKDIMDNEKGSNSKKRKHKHLEKSASKIEDNFKIDVEDPRFEAVYSSHLYAIDPSDSKYKKTKSMEALLNEKQQRRAKKNKVDRTITGKERKIEGAVKDEGKSKGKDRELSMLVKSIKSKTQQFNSKKNKKELRR